ncbi:hypothetical protein N7471_013458 [Penicillium samsonianum]|uniref:uncharacterized protein n=1 Tax=Penicillium samsonianum TaxID=1882272 RepID=UPI0025489F3F|nr:uncharacterized protein N7471_013458 [Penicillium samsonianum]KAJ6118838.1 hypothetical protein N7471_013458 [Penicillium samsonianum]
MIVVNLDEIIQYKPPHPSPQSSIPHKFESAVSGSIQPTSNIDAFAPQTPSCPSYPSSSPFSVPWPQKVYHQISLPSLLGDNESEPSPTIDHPKHVAVGYQNEFDHELPIVDLTEGDSEAGLDLYLPESALQDDRASCIPTPQPGDWRAEEHKDSDCCESSPTAIFTDPLGYQDALASSLALESGSSTMCTQPIIPATAQAAIAHEARIMTGDEAAQCRAVNYGIAETSTTINERTAASVNCMDDQSRSPFHDLDTPVDVVDLEKNTTSTKPPASDLSEATETEQPIIYDGLIVEGISEHSRNNTAPSYRPSEVQQNDEKGCLAPPEHGENDTTASIAPLLLQHEKQTMPPPRVEHSPRINSRPCSVSVVVPPPCFQKPGRNQPTPKSQAKRTKKRKRRIQACGHDGSDDSDDSDYVEQSDMEPIELPQQTHKRVKVAKLSPARPGHRTIRCSAPKVAQLEISENQAIHANMHDSETIAVRGFLTREIFLSKVVYSVTIEEQRENNCPHGPWKSLEDLDDAPGPSNRPSRPASHNKVQTKHTSEGSRFLPEEDMLLVELKERSCLPWRQIANRFPKRSQNALQVHYHTRLKNRNHMGLNKAGKQSVQPAATRKSSSTATFGTTSKERYGSPRARRPVIRYSPA